MGGILNYANFRAFVTRRGIRKSREEELNWLLREQIWQRLPVLALRNRQPADDDKKLWHLVWSRSANTRLAVVVTLETLRSWQAFRPGVPKKIIGRMSPRVADAVIGFQHAVKTEGVSAITTVAWKARRNKAALVEDIVFAMADAVGRLSSLKKNKVSTPMLGSKVMNFMMPEFFPVWDTAVVKKALAREDLTDAALGRWLSAKVVARLQETPHGGVGLTYARYVALMLRELEETPRNEYERIEKAYVEHAAGTSEADVDDYRSVVDYHFETLAPLVFEVCLLGKGCS